MSNLVDIRAVGPPRQRPVECEVREPSAADLDASTITQADRADDATRVTQLYGPHRKTHRDLSCIRVIAASAIVAGLLLGTAPVALAQVGHLLATVPAAFVQEIPALVASRTSTDEAKSDSAPTDISVRQRLATSTADQTDTGRGARCSGTLHDDGHTRTCEAA